ncbi:hypothetical protein GLOIN_2v1588487 [Rhizophagus irregularis DAOM 181602=DAOM 197198]|uniref:BED-type domain-containing protein n=1 Tax=Rhizophagus irregularis (strain DAOM 181602 / DAOM 197198 / MUCL 43194) TaxID=747089 RepID=A0A2P4Q6S6_RHIID|nr:hypothetical protein GLOIN_2v1588487 [Rhizophagus irregularis DAOM 181602=DAOM 197198]POG73288.1 hypothetical protein GLOIN_2v1588487 [Rhizophagus irregularis DAOM 181602=DAOM 197198]|eukprot:XP_025180154.1 hypothetical protein GLOIN_2v1588487 [Rhizophagus irregularis DAOM 181602=DAOM 197198]
MSEIFNCSLDYYITEEGAVPLLPFATHVSLQIIDTLPWNTIILQPESNSQEDTFQLIQPIFFQSHIQETSCPEQQQIQMSEPTECDNKENVTEQEKKIRILEFTCTYCNKLYRGKNARSILRRHLKTKHNINPPRGTRWDNDPNRPKTDEERRLRVLESKKRWAQKSRTKKNLEKASSPYIKQESIDEIPNNDNSDSDLVINSDLGNSRQVDNEPDLICSEYIKQERIDDYEIPNQVNIVEGVPNQVDINSENQIDMNLLYDAGSIKSTLLWLGVSAESDSGRMGYSDGRYNQEQNNFLIKEECE